MQSFYSDFLPLLRFRYEKTAEGILATVAAPISLTDTRFQRTSLPLDRREPRWRFSVDGLYFVFVVEGCKHSFVDPYSVILSKFPRSGDGFGM